MDKCILTVFGVLVGKDFKECFPVYRKFEGYWLYFYKIQNFETKRILYTDSFRFRSKSLCIESGKEKAKEINCEIKEIKTKVKG